ncbi:MAG: glycerol-3-phosphate acyltransferase [Prolixibacteraceae bacterium]
MTFQILTFSLTSYLVGCICFGYYLTKYLTGKNLKETGSQSLGATNTSRILGRKGFILTFTFDFLKGFLIAWIAIKYGFKEEYVFLFSLLVTIGHIWPVQLGFKGGKGVSTYTGTMYATNYQAAFPVIVLFLPLYLVTRKFSIAGIFSLTVIPFFLWYLDYSIPCIAIGFVQIFILLYAHRKNISEFMSFGKFR